MNTSPPMFSPPVKRALSLAWRLVVTLFVGVLAVWFTVDRYQRGAPRRTALAALVEVNRSLAAADSTRTLKLFVLPAAAAGRTPSEQAQWLGEILRDEISDAGIEEIRRHGRYGSLAEIFPEDASRWAESASLRVEDCVAFKLERNGMRCEVILARPCDGRLTELEPARAAVD